MHENTELMQPCAVGLSADLLKGGVHPITLSGTELVLWRDHAGHAHIWHDRCPHRGMRLSFGFVRENRLTCLYHGWEYGADGGCRKIPAHPDVTPPKTLCTDILTVTEAYGMIFVGEGDFSPQAQDDWHPVRSIFLDCTAELAAAALGLTEQKDNIYLDAQETVAWGVQACCGNTSAVHVTCKAKDPSERLELAQKIVGLRRQINQGAAA